jgi:hypothetical protein
MEDPKTSRLVEAVRSATATQPVDLIEVTRALDALLGYLTTPAGRTHSNCRDVDSYFSDHEEWIDAGLPNGIHGILADMASILHDTCSSPEIAENFDSTPEQLLNRLRKFQSEQDGTPNGG